MRKTAVLEYLTTLKTEHIFDFLLTDCYVVCIISRVEHIFYFMGIKTVLWLSKGKISVMYLSRNKIEKISQRIIAAYRKLPEVQKRPTGKVCPELLVNGLLGLSIEYHLLSPNGDILGLTSCGEVGVPIFDNPEQPEHLFLDGKTLLIDKRLIAEGANKGRYHFTLVHEACHQIYKILYPEEYAGGVARRQVFYSMTPPAFVGDYWEKWRANVLTSALLMPADMVRANMAAFGLGENLRMLNRVFAPDDYKHFQEMADHMGVSQRALSIRLKQLGLLGKDYLQDPYELVDVF